MVRFLSRSSRSAMPLVDLNLKAKNGFPALHYAVMANCMLNLKLLLADKRINPNITDRYGFTALHWAVKKSNIDALRILLLADFRLDSDIKGNNGLTAYDLIAYGPAKDPQLVQILSGFGKASCLFYLRY